VLGGSDLIAAEIYLQRHLISRSTLRKFRAEAIAHSQAAAAEA
jgi:hypothetical protein